MFCGLGDDPDRSNPDDLPERMYGRKACANRTSFSQVEYERPDGQGVLDLIDKAKEQAENDILPFGMIWTLRKIGDATQEFYSMMTIAQIRNYLDVNDTFYSEEMEYLDTFDARIQNSYNQMFSSIENSRFSSIQNMIFGESGAEDLQMSSQASSEEILSLQEQEKKLVAEYYYEYAQATVSTPEGEVLFSSLDSEGQSAYYNQFIQKYNQQFGELYLELVSLREQMAQALGYDSYTQVQIWICFETATPVRISKPSGKISSRPLRPFTAAIWKTFTGAQKTGISRDMCICWESSLPFRREAGRKH